MEKRILRRKKIKIREPLTAEIMLTTSKESINCKIWINDLSECGMNISTDKAFPEGTDFSIKLALYQETELDCQARWSKETSKDKYIIGIMFHNSSAKNRENIMHLMKWAEPYKEKWSNIIKRNVLFKTGQVKELSGFTAFVVSISPTGMEMLCSIKLPEREEFELIFALKPDLPELNVFSRVLYQFEFKVDCDPLLLPVKNKIWIEFLKADGIQKHIFDSLLQKV